MIVAILTYLAMVYGPYHLFRPNISHDYYADLMADSYAVPADEAAWPFYVEAFLARPPHDFFAHWEAPNWPYPKTAVEWEASYALHEAQTESLEWVRKASQRPRLGMRLEADLDPRLAERWDLRERVERSKAADEPLCLLWTMSPHLGPFRAMARGLVFDLRHAAEQGDGQRVHDNLFALIAMSDHVRETPLLLCDLVGIAIQALQINEMLRILTMYPDLLSDEAVLSLASRLKEVRPDGIGAFLKGERLIFLDTLQRVYSDDGNGDGHIVRAGCRLILQLGERVERHTALGEYLVAPWILREAAGRQETMQYYTEIMDSLEIASRKPLRSEAMARRWEDIEAKLGSEYARQQFPLAVILIPDVSQANRVDHMISFERNVALVVLALERHRRTYGEFPQTIDELGIPVPDDVYGGEPIRYFRRNGEPVLYSIGIDRDDDGGRPAAGGDTVHLVWRSASETEHLVRIEGPESDMEGDWVLYPHFD